MTGITRTTLSVMFVVALSSCAAANSAEDVSPATLGFEAPETTLIAEPPELDLADAERNLVRFHASWVCEFQRRTFVNPGDGEIALAEALSLQEIGSETYSMFLERLENSQELRDLVLFTYQEKCKG